MAAFRVLLNHTSHFIFRLPTNTLQSSVNLSKAFFHCGVPMKTLDKEVKDKDVVYKSASASKMESMNVNQTGLSDFGGLCDAGTVIPSQETMSSLFDGVRFDELPIVHIKSSPNNTIILVTDHTGRKFLARSSCGQEGFKNVKKSTNVAAQATGLSVGSKVLKMGFLNFRVVVKGLGAGRLASIKGLQMAGLNIVSLTDRTNVPRDGPRPRKARRL